VSGKRPSATRPQDQDVRLLPFYRLAAAEAEAASVMVVNHQSTPLTLECPLYWATQQLLQASWAILFALEIERCW